MLQASSIRSRDGIVRILNSGSGHQAACSGQVFLRILTPYGIGAKLIRIRRFRPAFMIISNPVEQRAPGISSGSAVRWTAHHPGCPDPSP